MIIKRAVLFAAVLIAITGCGMIDKRKESEAVTVAETVIATESTMESTQESVPEKTEEETAGRGYILPEDIELPKETEPEIEKMADDVRYRIVLATDMHYLASELGKNGDEFFRMVDYGDGKIVSYISEIMAAFLEEVKLMEPSILILSGDLTLEGEKLSHEELAMLLKQVEDAGIPVLVIPGNHDINNSKAAGYNKSGRFPAQPTSPLEFVSIYNNYGYDEAISRDDKSLSYVYDFNDEIRFLMLDSCQYIPVAKIGGMIKDDTYEWIEEQLAKADEEDAQIIPVSHHNLLDQSEIYVEDCTIEHSEKFISMLSEWEIPIYLSGHLHVQHTKVSDDGDIYEMTTASLATAPCQYGILDIKEDFSFEYSTRVVDMQRWSGETGESDENLINFSVFRKRFLERVFYNQADIILKQRDIPDEIRDRMAQMYAKINKAYYSGKAFEIKDEIENSEEFDLWEEKMFDTKAFDYITYIIRDAVKDYNYLTVNP